MVFQSKVGHEEWGIYAAVFALAFNFSFIADFGLNQYFTNQIAKHPDRTKELYRYMLPIKLSLFAIFPFIMCAIGYSIGYELKSIVMLGLVTMIHGFIQLMNFFRAGLQGQQNFKLDAYAQNFHKAILVILAFLLIYSAYTSTYNYAIAYLISLGIATFISYILLRRDEGTASLRWDIDKIKNLVRKSFPFALITLLYSFNERIDQVMIERLYGPVESGIYSAAYRILDAAMMYLWIVLPMFFSKFSHRNMTIPQKTDLLKKGVFITSLPIVLFTIAMFYGGTYVFSIFQNNEGSYIRIAQLFSILSLSLLVNGYFSILSTYLTSNNFTKPVNYLLIISIVFNGITNWIFIPQHGAFAAAWTTLGSTLILSVGYIVVMSQYTKIKLPYVYWLFSSIVLAIAIFFIDPF